LIEQVWATAQPVMRIHSLIHISHCSYIGCQDRSFYRSHSHTPFLQCFDRLFENALRR